jgi:hypothetical protein
VGGRVCKDIHDGTGARAFAFGTGGGWRVGRRRYDGGGLRRVVDVRAPGRCVREVWSAGRVPSVECSGPVFTLWDDGLGSGGAAALVGVSFGGARTFCRRSRGRQM